MLSNLLFDKLQEANFEERINHLSYRCSNYYGFRNLFVGQNVCRVG